MNRFNSVRQKLGVMTTFVQVFFAAIFGRIVFTPPRWASKTLSLLRRGMVELGPYCSRHRRGTVVVAVVLLSAVGGYVYYRSLPIPQFVEVNVDKFEPMAYQEGSKPNILRMRFSESAAPLAALNAPVEKGIQLTPPLSGTWHWESDSVLVFAPKDEWPAGKKMAARFERDTLASHVKLKDYAITFDTPAFEITSLKPEFYQDPKDPLLKRALLTLSLSHPVDLEDLQSKIFVSYGDSSKGVLGVGKRSFPFRVSSNKSLTEVVIQTDPIKIPDELKKLTFQIERGLRSKSGATIKSDQDSTLDIPGMYSYFQVRDLAIGFVENEQYEMERIIDISLSTDATPTEIDKNLSIYLLPIKHPDHPKDKDPFLWTTASVSESIISNAEKVKFTVQPTQYESSVRISAKFDAPAGRYIFAVIKKGAKSFGGYVLASDHMRAIEVSPFPERVAIMTKGSLLTLAGDKKISLAVRDVPNLRVTFSRVLPDDINHFITQSSGDFDRRRFFYDFGADNIAEVFSEFRDFSSAPAGKTQYTHVDFGKYLPLGKNGLFVLRASGWDEKSQREAYPNDQRIVLVTNLALLLKQAQDGTYHVYVQNTHNGMPVAGAKVDIVGKNGLTILSKTTDEKGHVVTPVLTDFKDEKTPIAVMASVPNDFTFIPFNLYDRSLKYSRFDVGGIDAGTDPKKLEAFVFSDRGIYRPGDKINIAAITRTSDWSKFSAGAPLMMVARDPRFSEIYRKKFEVSGSGLETFDFTTDDSSATGTYDIHIYTLKEEGMTDSLIGSTTVRVEEFLPDRLRIATRYSVAQTDGWLQPKDLNGQVTLMNLFGSPAQDRRIKASISLRPAIPAFKKYADYVFFDPLKTDQSYSESLAEAKTDAAGTAAFALPLEKFAKGIYQLNFIAEGFEAEGGRAVVSFSRAVVSSLDYLIGVKPDGNMGYIRQTDKRSVNLIAITPDQEKSDVSDLRIQVVENKYVSVLMKQDTGIYRYESVLKDEVIKTEPVTIGKSGVNYPIPTDVVGNFTLVVRDSNDVILNRLQFAVIGSGNMTMNLEKNAELQVKLEKSDFKPGETVDLQILAPYMGAGVITIERENVFQSTWFKATSLSSVQQIKIPEGLEGNAYISVNFLRAIDSKEIFMSPLSYAVLPITISRAARTSKISLVTPEVIEPGKTLAIKYKADTATDIILYGVDEGILQVAKYKTPEPLEFFYRKRALTTRTWQTLDLLIAEYSLQQSLSAPGGSEDALLGKNLNPFKRKSLKPVVFWSGILHASTSEQTYTYDVPDYFNGSLKIMAVAVSRDKIGTSERSTIVKGPFVLTPNTPLFVAPGDTFKVSLGVSNQLPQNESADVKVTIAPSKHFALVGSATQSLEKIKAGSESSVSFELRALDELGDADIEFVGIGAGKSAKVAAYLSVRPPTVFHVATNSGIAKSGKKDIPLERTLWPQFGNQRVTVGASPLAFVGGLATYMENYEHLCTEQLVSRGWTLFALKGIPEFARDSKKTEETVMRAMAALSARQLSNGSFSIWPSTIVQSDFHAVYGAHFLTDLADGGQVIPDVVREKVIRYLNEMTSMPDASIVSLRTISYGLYVLARNNVLHRDTLQITLKRLQEAHPKKWKDGLATAYIAATYALMKDMTEADKLMDEVKPVSKVELDYSDYYDDLRRNAQVLYILAKHFPNRAKALSPEILERFVSNITDGEYNSLTSSYVVSALSEFQKTQTQGDAIKVAFHALDGKSGASPLTSSPGAFPQAELPVIAKGLRIENNNSFPLYFQLVQSGFDRNPPKSPITQGLEINKEYTGADGKPLTSFKVGDEFDVTVRIRSQSKSAATNVAIVDLLPGGLEVELRPQPHEDARSQQNAGEGSESEYEDEEGDHESSNKSSPSYQAPAIVTSLLTNRSTIRPDFAEVREDRVVIYTTVMPGASEYSYRVRATSEGTFMAPGAFAESLYNRKQRAQSAASTIKIERP